MALRKPPATLPGAFEMRRLATRPAPAEGARPAPAAADPAPKKADPAHAPVAAPPMPKAAPRGRAAAGRRTVMLKATLPMPAAGHDATFDAAVQAYGEVKAFRAILSLALDAYAGALRDGRVTGGLPDYPRRAETVQVGRAIPADAFEKARAALDPLSLLPDGKLGIAVLRNALAWRFTHGG